LPKSLANYPKLFIPEQLPHLKSVLGCKFNATLLEDFYVPASNL